MECARANSLERLSFEPERRAFSNVSPPSFRVKTAIGVPVAVERVLVGSIDGPHRSAEAHRIGRRIAPRTFTLNGGWYTGSERTVAERFAHYLDGGTFVTPEGPTPRSE
ncbi:hypothetical protein GCM10028856_07530 [Halopiger thermotolerans]